ncbi:MAG: hypothetical protein ACRC9L_01825 [Brevinema sp.]
MKQVIAYLFVLHFFIGHVVALNVVPKMHVYPNALRPSFMGVKHLINTRDNRSYYDISFDASIDNNLALTNVSFSIPQFLDIHYRYILKAVAPLRMNLSVQPPPSFHLWYAFLDWFP